MDTDDSKDVSEEEFEAWWEANVPKEDEQRLADRIAEQKKDITGGSVRMDENIAEHSAFTDIKVQKE